MRVGARVRVGVRVGVRVRVWVRARVRAQSLPRRPPWVTDGDGVRIRRRLRLMARPSDRVRVGVTCAK